MLTTIYKVTNLLNGKCYIGKTCRNVFDRWAEHKKPSRQTVSALSMAINKYGQEHFIFEVIYITKNPELMERYFIRLHNTVSPNGYNLTYGGECYEWSEESRLKLAKSRTGVSSGSKGMKQTPDHINKRISPIRKPVIGVNLATKEIVEFESAVAAAKSIGGSNCSGAVSAVCLGTKYQAFGFTWKYKYESHDAYKPKFYRKIKAN